MLNSFSIPRDFFKSPKDVEDAVLNPARLLEHFSDPELAVRLEDQLAYDPAANRGRGR